MPRIRSLTPALALAGALLLAACGGADPSGDVASGPGGPDAVELVAVDTEFEPTVLELPAGETVEVEITNEGSATHDFTIDVLGLSTGPIDAGGVATATFELPEGETTFVCSLHGGMEGTITAT